MVEQHFCLRWNNYRTNITAEFETLREGEHFVDVTLACDGHQLKAHKVVLSACSPYFKELLQGNPCTHPIIILRDVAYTHMRSLLEFMYAGEVNISQVHLGAFLHTAEALKIRGLAESPDERKDQGGLNSISPLSALKSSLSGLGNIAMGSLNAPNLLERPLVPQLLTHHPDKPPGNPIGPPPPPPHHLPPHLVPPPLTLASAGTLPTTSHGVSGGPPSTSCSSSSSGSTSCNVTGVHPGPLPLTTVTQSSERPSRLEAASSERSPSPPPPLPPSKRLRLERRSPLDTVTTTPDKNNHRESNGTTSSSTTTTTTATIHAEDFTPTVPKIEPVDGGTSDAEGSGGWCGQEEGDSSSGGGERGGERGERGGGGVGDRGGGGVGGGGGGGVGGGSGPGPGPGPVPGPGPGPGPGGDVTTPGPTPPGGTPPDPENTSHLLQALSSESHLQGTVGPEEMDRPMPCEEIRHEMRYEVPQDPRQDHRQDPPLDLRGDPRGGDHRVDIRSDIRVVEVRGGGERTGTSPPLPPSSLPHSCQLCGKLISCRRNLWKHMERVHFNNPAVRCSLCAKMFKNKYALKDHQRIYHGGLSEPPPPPTHSASILSCILQDPRHQQPPQPHDPRGPPPLEMPQPALLPRDSHMRHHMDSPHTQSLSRRHHDEDDYAGATAYPSMGMGPIIPQSLAPTIGGSPSSMSRSRPDWPTQDDPLSLVNRALLSELHHLVTKAD